MAIKTYWADDNKIIIVREMIGHWTWEQFHKSQDTLHVLVDSVDHVVHQIIDMTASAALPTNYLTNLRQASLDVPERLGLRVVVSTNSFYQSMYDILARLYQSVTRHVVFVPDREQALQAIEMHIATIDSSS